METAWIVLASILVGCIALFLLGVYLIVRKVTNKASDVISEIPKDVVKESFVIGKELLRNKLKKSN
jgi:hypothetical protein